jgi:heme-degrading monooxygenase HmoA
VTNLLIRCHLSRSFTGWVFRGKLDSEIELDRSKLVRKVAGYESAAKERCAMGFAVMNIVSVPEDRRAEFERRFERRAQLVDNQPGFVRFLLLRPTQGDRYVVMTLWESKEDFERWVRSDAFRAGHAMSASDRGPEQVPVASSSEIWQFEVIEERDSNSRA